MEVKSYKAFRETSPFLRNLREYLVMPISASKFFLRDYAVPVSIGIHDSEKTHRQTVIINIEIYLENADVNRNDDIENTINYDFLRSEIEVLVKDRHFNLQETLCN